MREILEVSVAEYDPIELPGAFLQMSGKLTSISANIT